MKDLFSDPGNGVITIDEKAGTVSATIDGNAIAYPLASREGFMLASRAWLRATWDSKYIYSFTWFGRPVIQLPDDMMRLQELVCAVSPDVIIETGVAHGGSLVFYASLLKMLDKPNPMVVGVDIEIREHNAKAINAHPLKSMITTIESDSVAPDTLDRVRSLISDDAVVLVILDSNHTRDHVLAELQAYSQFVSPGSYIVAADGIMGVVAGGPRTGPDWEEDNPAVAARDFVASNPDFEIQQPDIPFNEGSAEDFVTYFPSGFLKRVR